jgi:hypothetical protein
MTSKINISKSLSRSTNKLKKKIELLQESCNFDCISFFNENRELVRKYLRKDTLKLEIDDFDLEEVPDSWYYKGKEGLLRANIKNKQFTFYQKLDWIKCGVDVVYFTKKHIKIISIDDGIIPFDLYDYQEESLHTYSENRFCVTLQCRQSGKTQTAASFITHFGLFNTAKMSAILAQKADQAQEILERIQLSYEMLPMYLQPGVKTYNKRSVIFGNNSKIQTFASGSGSVRGKSIACLYVDETAFIPNDMAFYESTYPTIASGKHSKIILTSTPNGTKGMFHKIWTESMSGINSYVRTIVTWDKVPGRDAEWKRETIANTSLEQFRQEHDVIFKGSSKSLISGEVLETLVKRQVVNRIDDVNIYHEVEENHAYVVIVDCSEGIGADYHGLTVIDISVSPYQVAAVYMNNKLSPLLLPSLIYNIATKYNDAIVLIENASSGGQVGSDLYYDLEYENTLMTVQEKGRQVLGFAANGRIGVKTSKQVKATGCSTIKTLIENNKIELNDADLIDQLGDFVPKGGSYAAASGANDDLVMTIVLFGWLTTQTYFVELTDIDVRKKLFNDMVDRSVESMLPFGIIDDEFGEFDGNMDMEGEESLSYGLF